MTTTQRSREVLLKGVETKFINTCKERNTHQTATTGNVLFDRKSDGRKLETGGRGKVTSTAENQCGDVSSWTARKCIRTWHNTMTNITSNQKYFPQQTASLSTIVHVWLTFYTVIYLFIHSFIHLSVAQLTMFSAIQIIQHQILNEWWIMNWKWRGRNRALPNWYICLGLNADLQNKKLESYSADCNDRSSPSCYVYETRIDRTEMLFRFNYLFYSDPVMVFYSTDNMCLWITLM